MTIRIGLLSDTHGYVDPSIWDFFSQVDEIWHAGDIGSVALADDLEKRKPSRIVTGNIDGADLRKRYPEVLRFSLEGLEVFMTHIAGRPGKYDRHIREELTRKPPGLMVAGHSHILKIQMDPVYGFLFVNPGAAGNYGWHLVKTALRFTIDQGIPGNMEIIEIPRKKATQGILAPV
jgi:putative phosphoesterase